MYKKYKIFTILCAIILFVLVICIKSYAFARIYWDPNWLNQQPTSKPWEKSDVNEYYFKFMIDKNNNWQKQEEIKKQDSDSIQIPNCSKIKLFYKFKGWKLNNDIYHTGQEVPIDTFKNISVKTTTQDSRHKYNIRDVYLYAEYDIDYIQVAVAIILGILFVFLIIFLINKYKKVDSSFANNNIMSSESDIDKSIYCRKCGKKLDKNSVCCNYCGEKISEVDNKSNNTN